MFAVFLNNSQSKPRQIRPAPAKQSHYYNTIRIQTATILLHKQANPIISALSSYW